VTSLDVRSSESAYDRGTSHAYPDVHHWIGGQAVADGPRFLDVLSPSTGAVISRVPLGGAAEGAELDRVLDQVQEDHHEMEP
jgi:hypothetical protein